ncbi:hypothetical protein ANRL4_03080 [Anaerolineae bacterium]|nr:hypothetical protein ANRL4_03080 [Anaerolineae bacterium]
MSLDFYIRLETDFDLVGMSELIDKVGIQWNSSSQQFEHIISKVCDFFYLGIVRISPSLSQALSETRQIRVPKFSIVMSWKGYTSTPMEAELHMVEIVVFLLKELKGDLSFDYEGTPYLIRRSGQVLLSKEVKYWEYDPRYLMLIPTPYQWVEKLP